MTDPGSIPPDLWTRLCDLLADARAGRYDGGRIVLEVDPAGQVSAIVQELRVKHRRNGVPS